MPDKRECETCCHPLSTTTYSDAMWRGDILRQTPKSVWDEYLADGYTLIEAVNMEMSYA